MAKSNVTEELAQAIESLQTRREALLKEIEEIDQTFEKFGIDAGAALPSSRGRGKKKRGRGRPRRRCLRRRNARVRRRWRRTGPGRPRHRRR